MLLLASAMVLLASSHALSLMSIWLLNLLPLQVFQVPTSVGAEEFGLHEAQLANGFKRVLRKHLQDQAELLGLRVVFEPFGERFGGDKKAGCLVKKSMSAAPSTSGMRFRKSLGMAG